MFLRVAQELLDLGHPADSTSRSYYAVFHAATAVLTSLGVERSSHRALWSAFGEHVVAPNLMERRFHRDAISLFMARNESDYLPEPTDTPEDAERSLAVAEQFVQAAKAFLDTRSDSR
jgi:uncharacterized protein (UPF0332 family)